MSLADALGTGILLMYQLVPVGRGRSISEAALDLGANERLIRFMVDAQIAHELLWNLSPARITGRFFFSASASAAVPCCAWRRPSFTVVRQDVALFMSNQTETSGRAPHRGIVRECARDAF